MTIKGWESDHRTRSLDIVICVSALIVLLIGASILFFLAYLGKPASVAPNSRRFRDAYARAVWRFGRMFQGHSQSSSSTDMSDTSSEPFGRNHHNKNHNHSNIQQQPIDVDSVSHRHTRFLQDHSMGIDLTKDTNLSYAVSLLSNHHPIVATNSHLEYCFNDTSSLISSLHQFQQQQLTRSYSEERLKQLQLAYLPPIAEARSVESGSPAVTPRHYHHHQVHHHYHANNGYHSHLSDNFINSISESSSNSFRDHVGSAIQFPPSRKQIRRAIILFTGAEDRDLWLYPEDDDDEDNLRDELNENEEDNESDFYDDGYKKEVSDDSQFEYDLNGNHFSVNIGNSRTGKHNQSTTSYNSKRRRESRNSFDSSSSSPAISPVSAFRAIQEEKEQRRREWSHLLLRPSLFPRPNLSSTPLSPKHSHNHSHHRSEQEYHYSNKSTTNSNVNSTDRNSIDQYRIVENTAIDKSTANDHNHNNSNNNSNNSNSNNDSTSTTSFENNSDANHHSARDESLPPYPGSLYPRQLQPITIVTSFPVNQQVV